MVTSDKSAKGWGARYGLRLRSKFGKIFTDQSSLYKCPYCSYIKVKRLAVGIWFCKKCNSKFTSRAYRVEKVQSLKTTEGVGIDE